MVVMSHNLDASYRYCFIGEGPGFVGIGEVTSRVTGILIRLTMARKFDKSRRLQKRAEAVIPGGVNSPVRAFRAVGGDPPFMVRGEGSRIWDADGNEYIDYVGSWGP